MKASTLILLSSFPIILLLFSKDLYAQGLTIGNGTTLSLGTATLSLPNNLVSLGTITGENSTVILNGTALQTLNNSPSDTYNHLTVDNPSGVSIGSNILVNGTMTLSNGVFDATAGSVILGSSGSIVGEQTGRYVLGKLQTTVSIGSNQSSSFNGIGATLGQGTEDLGNVTLLRTTGTAVALSTFTSIKRTWMITAQNGFAAARNLTLTWLPDDDNGKNLASMCVLQSSDDFATLDNTTQINGVINGSSRTVNLSLNSLTAAAPSSFTLTQVTGISVLVNQPNGGEVLNAGTTYDIKWTVEQTYAKSSILDNLIRNSKFDSEKVNPGVGDPTATIYYSLDGGVNWISIPGASGFNQSLGQHTYTWTVPFVQSSACKIKVQYSDGNGDQSDNNFTIFGINLTTPNGSQIIKAGDVYPITWNSSAAITNVKLDYSTDGGATWLPIVATTANTGTFNWTVPNTPSYNCLVQVSKAGLATPFGQYDICDNSNVPFTIKGILALSPNGNSWNGGLIFPIVWTSTVGNHEATVEANKEGKNINRPVGTVKIEYSSDNGNSWNLITKGVPDNGQYDWLLPYVQSKNCLVRITSNEDPAISNVSRLFEIWVIEVTTPNGGEHWMVGNTNKIFWQVSDLASPQQIIALGAKAGQKKIGGSASSYVNYVKIEFSTNNGINWNIVKSRQAAGKQQYDWVIPNTVSDNCLVRVTKFDNTTFRDASDNVFAIGTAGAGAQITVWPGDANNDGVVSQTDFDVLKQYENKTGPVRQNATTDWLGQPADAWIPLGATYADCNGDGAINADDFYVVMNNWGKMHGALAKTLAVQVTDYKLLQNFPNPFNPSTTIQFELLEMSRVNLKIYNLLGEVVANLVDNENLAEGIHQVKWQPNDLSSGIYIYRIDIKSFESEKVFTTVKKLQYLR